jgi:ubiquinone/menaquinone biosynthesis C-methylase UbiE
VTGPALEDGDVPYGDDWQDAGVVAAWVKAADRTRPWRVQIRAFIAEQVSALMPGARVLELGAGPGLLAECVLPRCPAVASYTLLDFSTDMLSIGRERLARFGTARFLLASFKSPDWVEQVDRPVDCVVSMQAVHELRNKRHAQALYRQVHRIAADDARILICDHVPFDDSAKSTTLYMTVDEQLHALRGAGFMSPRVLLSLDSLRLYACEKKAGASQ